MTSYDATCPAEVSTRIDMLARVLDECRVSLQLEERDLTVDDSVCLGAFSELTAAEFAMLLRLLQVNSDHCCHNQARLESAAMTIQASMANPFASLYLTFSKSWNLAGGVVPIVRATLDYLPVQGYETHLRKLSCLLLD